MVRRQTIQWIFFVFITRFIKKSLHLFNSFLTHYPYMIILKTVLTGKIACHSRNDCYIKQIGIIDNLVEMIICYFCLINTFVDNLPISSILKYQFSFISSSHCILIRENTSSLILHPFRVSVLNMRTSPCAFLHTYYILIVSY